MKWKNFFLFMSDPVSRFEILSSHGFYNWMSDKAYLEKAFKIRMGTPLNLDNPKTFNEKIQWLKLYDRNPKYTRMVDKYEVKKYVADLIGDQYIVPTYGVYDKYDEIDFDALPERFVLKCTHDSGSVFIVKNKAETDFNLVKRRINKCLKRNYYLHGREWPYKNVNRKILAEEFLEDEASQEPKDYKMMVFNGEVKCSFVCSERFSSDGLKVTFYDREWNVMPFERHYPKSTVPIKKPENYDTMVQLAENLAANFPFVRIDFYEVSGQIYFGEITLYPGSGWEEFRPEEWDKKLGEWIDLPL